MATLTAPPPRCSICAHPRRDEIDRELVDPRRPALAVIRKYELSKPALYRHRENHLPVSLLAGMRAQLEREQSVREARLESETEKKAKIEAKLAGISDHWESQLRLMAARIAPLTTEDEDALGFEGREGEDATPEEIALRRRARRDWWANVNANGLAAIVSSASRLLELEGKVRGLISTGSVPSPERGPNMVSACIMIPALSPPLSPPALGAGSTVIDVTRGDLDDNRDSRDDRENREIPPLENLSRNIT